MEKVNLNTDLVKSVVSSEKAIARRKAKNADNTAQNNTARLENYAGIAVEIADPKRFPRNKDGDNFFDTTVSGEIKRQLENAGVSESQAKYYYRLSTKLVETLRLNSNATITQVVEFFGDNEITSEAKLKAFFSGDGKKSKYDKLLDKAVGRLTKTGKVSTEPAVLKSVADIEKFAAECKARLADAKREDEAVKKAAADNATVNDVIAKAIA
ncbi:MAG: hypothetical protein CMK23_05870 [Porticoccaceae bacterium]|nr:hypothetical protein [Porticoccaceae bacterium]|tara:strand:+ start:896 stop:1531 length:636 start_codon:yes stop_codon:yes gene_type:complete